MAEVRRRKQSRSCLMKSSRTRHPTSPGKPSKDVTNVKRSGEWLNMESRNLVPGRTLTLRFVMLTVRSLSRPTEWCSAIDELEVVARELSSHLDTEQLSYVQLEALRNRTSTREVFLLSVKPDIRNHFRREGTLRVLPASMPRVCVITLGAEEL